MKKNILLSLVVLVLGFVAYRLLFKSYSDDFANSEHTQFAYEYPERLGKIFIADAYGQAALLEKRGDAWFYTHYPSKKTYPANPPNLAILLKTIQDLRARNPVAKGKRDLVINEIRAKGKKVELYDVQGNKVRTFYVGGPTAGGEATHMQMEGSDKPYLVYIPRWVGTVDTRFSIEEKAWRDPALFRLKTKDIEWIEVRYADPEQAEMSFRLEQYPELKVLSLGSKQKTTTPKLNRDNAQTYLEDFDVLGAEVILKDENGSFDSIQKTPLFAEVRYKTRQLEAAQSFKLYPLINPTADRGDGEVGTRQKIQRYFALIDREQFYLMQHIVIRKILWAYDFFFQAEKVVLAEDETAFIDPANAVSQD